METVNNTAAMVRKQDNVVLAVSNNIEKLGDRIIVEGTHYLDVDLLDVIQVDKDKVPAAWKPLNYTYVDGVWTKDDSFLPPLPIEEKVKLLEAENEQLKADSIAAMEATAELYEMLIAKGV